MPNVYTEEQMAFMQKWVADHRYGYLHSGGVKGHVMDMRFLGGYRYETMLLLRYVGRRSGKTLITGLGYAQIGSEIGILASLGGADFHPQWYLNMKAGGPVAIQIATEAFNATWREAEGDELEEGWKWMIKSNPLFAAYRKNSKRQIPLILLNPLEQIPVFTELAAG
jgi:deazaflavin-dependent oxidoreductase (nitroreductase family)